LYTLLSHGGLSARQAQHLAALKLAAHGQWPSAVAVLDRHLLCDPYDLVGHQCALRLDGYLGRFHRTAARSARALPFWSKDDAGYGIMLSFYGFGLEELGDYARAEDVARAAAELEPYGYWPHHAVSHVLEMTGRPAEGLAWMDGRAPFWSDAKCNNRVLIWWHKALFHIVLGQQQLHGMSSPFNEIHAAMTALLAGHKAVFETVLDGMRRAAAADSELVRAYRDVAIPVAQAMACFVDADYAGAVNGLLGALADLWRMGGSVAQRDLVEWTLAAAAIRAGQQDIALSLVNERLALRPHSSVNHHFVREAEAARLLGS